MLLVSLGHVTTVFRLLVSVGLPVFSLLNCVTGVFRSLNCVTSIFLSVTVSC